MALFDASNRDQCEVKRSKTNTPLQALMMMNDPTVLEASRVMAQKLLPVNSAIDQKLTKAFRLIVCRNPTAKELDILQGYYNEQLDQFKQNKLNAQETIKTGEYPMIENMNANDLAALMKVIEAIYNMEESITKT